MINYKTAKIIKSQKEKEHSLASKIMQSYPKGNLGLTPDSVKGTAQWRTDYSTFKNTQSNLKNFNRLFIREFKKEYLAERKQKYGNILWIF